MIQRPCYGWIVHGFACLVIYCAWVSQFVLLLCLVLFNSYTISFILLLVTDLSITGNSTGWYTTTRHWTRKWCRPSNLRAVDSPIFWHGLQLSNGTTLHSLFTSEQVKFDGFGFMDDVDMVATDNLHQALLLNSQQLKNHFGTWLQVFGGHYLPKSHWTIIDFHWKNGHWQYRFEHELLGTLFMNDVSGHHLPLDQL